MLAANQDVTMVFLMLTQSRVGPTTILKLLGRLGELDVAVIQSER